MNERVLPFDFHYAETCVVLTMSLTLAMFLASLELEHEDFLRAELFNDFARHLCAVDEGSADFGLASVLADQEDFVEDDLTCFFASELFHVEDIAFFDTVLLATSLNDCMHCAFTLRLRPLLTWADVPLGNVVADRFFVSLLSDFRGVGIIMPPTSRRNGFGWCSLFYQNCQEQKGRKRWLSAC